MKASLPLEPISFQLLSQLESEERLLLQARQALADLVDVLLSGEVSGVFRIQQQNDQLEAQLRDFATAREKSAQQLAELLGVIEEPVTLVSLAAKLPDSLAQPMLQTRDRLQKLMQDITNLQRRCANLAHGLRCYFHTVLSGVGSTGNRNVTSSRYGPQGVRVVTSAGYGLSARG